MDSNTVDTEDIPILEEWGLLSPATNGIRKIASTTIYTSSSGGDSGDSAVDVHQKIAIPEFIVSVQALQWIGFTEEAAKMQWEDWVTRPRDWPLEFVDTTIEQLARFDNDAEAILAEEFADIRTTATAKFWIMDTIETAWHTLLSIKRLAKQQSHEIRQGMEAKRRLGAQYPLQPPSPTHLRGGRLPEPTPYMDRTPGATTLYKGVDVWRTQPMNPAANDIDISRLASTPPTDFVGRPGAVFYFTTERSVAERYCKYAKRRESIHSTCIVEMSVPNSLIKQANLAVVPFGNEWKQLVWHSRRGTKSLPKDIRHLERRQLVIGDTCHNHNKRISKLEHWSEITEDNVLFVDSETRDESTGQVTITTVRATQYAWWGDDVQSSLEEQFSFKITRSLAG
ncbi:MAG: hypothetical protein Q9191_000317 [Dirinaria sp. TL-2023a]